MFKRYRFTPPQMYCYHTTSTIKSFTTVCWTPSHFALKYSFFKEGETGCVPLQRTQQSYIYHNSFVNDSQKIKEETCIEQLQVTQAW